MTPASAAATARRTVPYGVIQMAYREEHHFSLLSWLLLGRGPGPW